MDSSDNNESQHHDQKSENSLTERNCLGRKRKLSEMQTGNRIISKKDRYLYFSNTSQGTNIKRYCKTKKSSLSEDAETNPINILDLPNEMISNLVLYLKPVEIGTLASTCKRMNQMIEENQVWRSLCRSHFSIWNDHVYDINHANSSPTSNVDPYIGKHWKRQYVMNHTKELMYHCFGSGCRDRKTHAVSDTSTAYGFRKICCSRDHVFALDFGGILHIYRWEREHQSSNFVYKKTRWQRDFSKHVIDIATDPRYDNNARKYVYVLSQSALMQSRRYQISTRGTDDDKKGCNKYGVPCSGDKIDVFDERSCRRIFNMTFDPEMRFTSIKLTSAESQQKTLYMLTDAGKVYSLHLFEPSLLNLGTEGIQVNLKSASKSLGEKVKSIESNIGVVSFITESGKMHIVPQRQGDYNDLFGKERSVKLGVPVPLHHIAKVVKCSIGARHLGFIDEYGRAFVQGCNRYGQLGTGDRMDRTTPTQVMCTLHVRALHCSLNHTLAIAETSDSCAVYGSGCGYDGRLPGHSRGSLEFAKLDVKVSWNARQIDAHKECLFVLSCRDIEERPQFTKLRYGNDWWNKSVPVIKTFQELLMDIKKTKSLCEKVQFLEMMVTKVESSVRDRGSLSDEATSKKTTNSESNFESYMGLSFLKKAVRLLGNDAERLQLDMDILKRNTESPKSNV